MKLASLSINLEEVLTVEDGIGEQSTTRAYKPKHMSSTPWVRIEESRDPTGFESAEYSVRANGNESSWTLRRHAHMGYPEMIVLVTSSLDAAKSYCNFLVAHDSEMREALYNLAHGKDEMFMALASIGLEFKRNFEASLAP